MKRVLILTALIVAAALPPSQATAGSPSASAAKHKGTLTISQRSTRYGTILTDGRGRALYLFTKDSRNHSRCGGACARAWPVLYQRGRRVKAAHGARQSFIGVAHRPDGHDQVTYRGHPLYYYVGDTAPAQVTCQNVYEFGGTWLVLRASGRAVH